MEASQQFCWLHDHDDLSNVQDDFKKIRWEQTLRPLSPGLSRRNSKRTYDVSNERKPRPISHSPDRKYMSTVASRLKQKDGVQYHPRPKKMRPVSCPPTPVLRPKPKVQEKISSPKPTSVVKTKPEKKKRSDSLPRVTFPPPSAPTPTPKYDHIPSEPANKDYAYSYKGGSLSSGSRKSSSDGSKSSKKKIKRSRNESMSSYSSSSTVVHHYDGCQIM